jgi:glycosyltransferase involved in cell wall biosynthesis
LEEIYKKHYLLVEKIIIRSKLLLDSIDAEYDILEQLTIYGLPIHLENVLRLNNKFKEIWAQSEKIKDLYVSNGIQEDKIQITPPMGWKYDFELESRKDDEIRLIYVGTLRDEENILEIIEEFRKIHIERPEVKLKIVYGKINGNKEFTEKIMKIQREGIEGIEFKNNLTHKETCYEIATSDIGICWRKNGWGEDGQTSTKEQEYKIYNLSICNNLALNFF